jgi:Tic22-like family protein
VVSTETEKAIEVFVRREDAERFLEQVSRDDPELASQLRLEPIELDD